MGLYLVSCEGRVRSNGFRQDRRTPLQRPFLDTDEADDTPIPVVTRVRNNEAIISAEEIEHTRNRKETLSIAPLEPCLQAHEQAEVAPEFSLQQP